MRRCYSLCRCLLVCLLGLLALNTPGRAEPPIVAPSRQQASADQRADQVTLTFPDTDIPAVLQAMSLFTQRNFVVDPRVKGKLTLMSEHPVSRAQALDMLASALRMRGYALVDVGGVTRVVPAADAKLQGAAVVGGAPAEDASRGGVVTRVFPLRYENANNLLAVLRPLVPPDNAINAYPGNNTIVVTDYADNLDRIARIIANIDVPTSVDTDVVPIRYGIATDVAALVMQLLDAQGADTGQRIVVVADPLSNSVLIRSGSPARTKLARDLINKLDRRQENTGGSMHVVYLRNAQAAHIARVLGGLLAGRGQTQSVGQNGGAGGGSGLADATAGSRGASMGLSGGAQASASRSSAQLGLNSSGASSSTQGGLGNSQPIERQDADDNAQPVSYAAAGAVVQADPSTNSLIISAPDPLYRNLREVIDQLDQRRSQVMVESLIVEVSQDVSAQFGIQWMTGGGNLNGSGTGFVGGTNLGGSGVGSSVNGATTLDALASGMTLGVIKGTTTVLGNQLINLNVLARAMQDKGQTNILSTPNLLTLDNQQASIMVGKTVPFVTGQYVTTGGGSSANPFQTIERQDIGLKLNIRPQVSEGGAVKLDIYQEVSSIDTANSNATTGIVTNKRAIDTSVLADDGDIIVLGGLLEDSVTLTTNSVPGLSSIPILGELFRYDSREHVKTNLMVFLRPYVLRNQQDSNNLTMSRYDYIRRVQGASQPDRHWLLPDMAAPVLSPLDAQKTAAAPSRVNPSSGAAAEPIEQDEHHVTLQIARASDCHAATPIVKGAGASGLLIWSQPGPGGSGCVVRTQVANDPAAVDSAMQSLRELGYQPEQVK